MTKRKRSLLGNATIEFTLIGIPLMFVLISIFELARGMWVYHTLAYAVKEGTRYAVVRGQNSPNQVPLGGTGTGLLTPICTYITQQGPGLIPHDLTLTFHSATQGDITSLADACPTKTATGTNWPQGGTFASPEKDGGGNSIVDNQQGETIMITGTIPFKSAIALFWPGVKGGGMEFPAFTFPATASETMQF